MVPRIIGQDLTSREAAFSIDLVLDGIFRELRIPDLLSCRRVCRKWNLIAASKLERKHTEIHFQGGRLYESAKTLEDLLELLDKSNNSDAIPSQFPCGKYIFVQTYNQFEYFFDTHIDQNYYNYNYNNNNSDNENYCCNPNNDNDIDLEYFNPFLKDQNFSKLLSNPRIRIHTLNLNLYGLEMDVAEIAVLRKIRDLLLLQSDYLRALTLHVMSNNPREWWQKRSKKHLKTNFDFDTTNTKSLLSSEKTMRKLKIVILPKYSLENLILLDNLIPISPNLDEIRTNQQGYMYFFKRPDRIKYLKQLNFITYDEAIYILDANHIIYHAKGNLQLRFLNVRLEDFAFEFRCTRTSWNYERLCKVVKILNQILETCNNSIESMHWYEMSHFPGLQWPKWMPKVKELGIHNPYTFGEKTLFGQGFDMNRILPYVRRLKFCHSGGMDYFMSFFEYLDFEPSRSVKSIYVGSCSERNPQSFPGSSVEVREELDDLPKFFALMKKLFPCARIYN